MPSKRTTKPKSLSQPKPTEQRVVLPGQKKECVVYVGSRGGKYVKKNGTFVNMKDVLKKTGKGHKGGGDPNCGAFRKDYCTNGCKWDLDQNICVLEP